LATFLPAERLATLALVVAMAATQEETLGTEPLFNSAGSASLPSSRPVTSESLQPAHNSPQAVSTADAEAGQISCEDIQKVQNLIEKCLQLYMTQEEVVSTLKSEAGIQPRFTTLVWQKLEEQNPEFFRAYYTRLKLKDQIVLFNHLLEQQVQMFQRFQGGWLQAGAQQLVANQPPITTVQALPAGYLPSLGLGAQAIVQAAPASNDAQRMHGIPSTAQVQLPSSSPHFGGTIVSSPQPAPMTATPHAAAFIPTSLGNGPPSASMGFAVGAGHFSAPQPQSGLPAQPVSAASDSQPAAHTPSVPMVPASGPAAPAPTTDALSGSGMADGAGEMGGLPRNFSLSDFNIDLQGNMQQEAEGGFSLLQAIGGDDLGLELDPGVGSNP